MPGLTGMRSTKPVASRENVAAIAPMHQGSMAALDTMIPLGLPILVVWTIFSQASFQGPGQGQGHHTIPGWNSLREAANGAKHTVSLPEGGTIRPMSPTRRLVSQLSTRSRAVRKPNRENSA